MGVVEIQFGPNSPPLEPQREAPPPSLAGLALPADDRAPEPHPPRRSWLRVTLLAGVGALAFGAVARAALNPETEIQFFERPAIDLDPVTVEAPARPRLYAQPITEELRHHGYHACYPPDPMGLGPYAPYYRAPGPAHVAIPQEGGHTDDMGFDVIVHFHGADPIRKTLVQVATGVVFVGIDKGMGSGPYSDAYSQKGAWPRLLRGVEAALKKHSGDPRAHIRHLALTSWSAGYGAVNEILRVHGDEGIDAVVLLDSLHCGYDPAARSRDGSLKDLSSLYVQPIFDYAARAAKGEKVFVLSHSNIVPAEGYPSVKRSADLLLSRVGVERKPRERNAGLLEQLTTADQAGFHVWGYAGRYEHAHCGHVAVIADVVRDVLEPAWNTPLMNRNVPWTPAPKLGG